MICLSRNSSSFLKFLFQSWEKRSLKRICCAKNEYFDCWWPAGRRLRAIEGSLCGRGERKGLMEGSMQEMHPHMVWPREGRESMDCKLPKERTGPWENGNQLSIWLLLKRGGERRRGEEMENSCQLFRAYKPHKFWHFFITVFFKRSAGVKVWPGFWQLTARWLTTSNPNSDRLMNSPKQANHRMTWVTWIIQLFIIQDSQMLDEIILRDSFNCFLNLSQVIKDSIHKWCKYQFWPNLSLI